MAEEEFEFSMEQELGQRLQAEEPELEVEIPQKEEEPQEEQDEQEQVEEAPGEANTEVPEPEASPDLGEVDSGAKTFEEAPEQAQDSPEDVELTPEKSSEKAASEEVTEPKKESPQEELVHLLIRLYLPQVLEGLRRIELAIKSVLKIGNRAKAELEPVFENYLTIQIIYFITGVVLLFFGQFYSNIKSCIGALKFFGPNVMAELATTVHVETQKVMEANEIDNKLDEDGDGIPDVEILSEDDLTTRKVLVFFKACSPQKVSDILIAVAVLLLIMVAALRVRFVRTICLGATIGDNIFIPIKNSVIPAIEEFTSRDFHPWYPLIFLYICRIFGVVIAVLGDPILSIVSGSARGARLITESAAEIGKQHKIEILMNVLFMSIAFWIFMGIGILSQLILFSYLPTPIKIFTFPFYVVESGLHTFANAYRF